MNAGADVLNFPNSCFSHCARLWSEYSNFFEGDYCAKSSIIFIRTEGIERLTALFFIVTGSVFRFHQSCHSVQMSSPFVCHFHQMTPRLLDPNRMAMSQDGDSTPVSYGSKNIFRKNTEHDYFWDWSNLIKLAQKTDVQFLCWKLWRSFVIMGYQQWRIRYHQLSDITSLIKPIMISLC
jgi:hypothetical protein